MKKVVFILAMLLFSFNSFAKSEVVSDKLVINDSINIEVRINSDNMDSLHRYTYHTSCGRVAVSYSYEPVSASDLNDWKDAMEEYYCEQL